MFESSRSVLVQVWAAVAVVGCGGDDPASLDAAVVDAAPVDAAPDAPVRQIYAGKIDDATSAWQSLPGANGQLGLAAGNMACRQAFTTADHACDYAEVQAAAAAGQLTTIPAGVTAWVQRTTPADVGGMTSPAGQGGNCVDWTFTGNHLADGEYMTFATSGVPTYVLDPDTRYDGADTSHADPGAMPCFGVSRSILCCTATP